MSDQTKGARAYPTPPPPIPASPFVLDRLSAYEGLLQRVLKGENVVPVIPNDLSRFPDIRVQKRNRGSVYRYEVTADTAAWPNVVKRSLRHWSEGEDTTYLFKGIEPNPSGVFGEGLGFALDFARTVVLDRQRGRLGDAEVSAIAEVLMAATRAVFPIQPNNKEG